MTLRTIKIPGPDHPITVARDLDIVVAGGDEAGLRCLPAGPLREGRGALGAADFVVGEGEAAGRFAVRRTAAGLVEDVAQARPSALGALAGGWVAARLAGRSGVTHGVVVGGLLMLAGIANNLMLPPPMPVCWRGR